MPNVPIASTYVSPPPADQRHEAGKSSVLDVNGHGVMKAGDAGLRKVSRSGRRHASAPLSLGLLRGLGRRNSDSGRGNGRRDGGSLQQASPVEGHPVGLCKPHPIGSFHLRRFHPHDERDRSNSTSEKAKASPAKETASSRAALRSLRMLGEIFAEPVEAALPHRPPVVDPLLRGGERLRHDLAGPHPPDLRRRHQSRSPRAPGGAAPPQAATWRTAWPARSPRPVPGSAFRSCRAGSDRRARERRGRGGPVG